MIPELDVIELDQDELALAWPLVRASSPELQLEGWQTFAEALIDRGGGVLAVAAPDQALHGVATYEPIEKPRFGRMLHVDTLVIFELSGSAPTRKVLVGALRQVAAALGCSETVISASKRPRRRGSRSNRIH
jgi:hypothetical protein